MQAGDLTQLATVKSWLTIATANDDAILTRLITSASQYVQSWLNRSFAVKAVTETRNGTGTQTMVFGNYPVVSVTSVTVDGVAIPLSPDGVQAGYTFDSRCLYLLGYQFSMRQQGVKLIYTYGYQQSAEAQTIPAGSPYTLPVAGLFYPWNADVAVSFASGVALTKIASGTPTTGQYTCLATAGVWTYTFAAADTAKAITITYSYTPQEIEQAVIELVALRYRERSRIGENSKSVGGEVVSYNVKDFPDSVKTILNNYRRVVSVY